MSRYCGALSERHSATPIRYSVSLCMYARARRFVGGNWGVDYSRSQYATKLLAVRSTNVSKADSSRSEVP
mgnify:CR=1 FL=1